jgi:hypothetical protein
MTDKRARNRGVLPWKSQVTAALAEFDLATTPTERTSAITKLEVLFAGEGRLKRVLRKCLASIKTVELLERRQGVDSYKESRT